MLEPVTLEGRFVRLEPLRIELAEPLLAAATPETFRYFTHGVAPWSVEGMRSFIEARSVPGSVPFAVWCLARQRWIGSTTCFDIDPIHRSLEIGFTWYASEAQGTAVNPECKLLLMTHAFEHAGAQRVQFKTDLRNLVSQRALEKLGATREGVFRRHRLMADGGWRDSVYYSVIAPEWPRIEAALRRRLQAFDSPK